MEERRGNRLERLTRVAGRGREETTPVIVHNMLMLVLAVLVGTVVAITLVLWLVLR